MCFTKYGILWPVSKWDSGTRRTRGRDDMKRPRLIYYNDAHHFHAKRMEPPASIHMLEWPVNEVAGTGVDLLVLGLGYGDVYFHQSKVGRVVGQQKEVWENYIDWRIMRMVEEAAKKGTDQLREVIRRGRETGISVYPSIKLQSTNARYSERCGRLKWERGAEVCIGEPGRNEWGYDYALKEVRDENLAVIREVLEDYEADGIELDYMFGGQYFKSGNDEGTQTMNAFVADVRELATQIGQRQGREVGVMARVGLLRDGNLEQCLDTEQWLRDGSLDYIVGQDPFVVSETGVRQSWMPDAANANGAAAYYRPPRRVYDERVGLPSIEMYRALNQTLVSDGWAGQYHGYLLWPFAQREYQILRELAHPEVHVRSHQAVHRAAARGTGGRADHDASPRAAGGTQGGGDLVGDDSHRGRHREREGRRRDAQAHSDDQILLLLHRGRVRDQVQRRDAAARPGRDHRRAGTGNADDIAGRHGPSSAPLGMSAHWFRFSLPIDLVKRGDNFVRGRDVQVRASRRVQAQHQRCRGADALQGHGATAGLRRGAGVSAVCVGRRRDSTLGLTTRR